MSTVNMILEVPTGREPLSAHVTLIVFDLRFMHVVSTFLVLSQYSLFTCGEASRSISDAFLLLPTLPKSSLLRGHRAIITIIVIFVEVLDLSSDQCDHM